MIQFRGFDVCACIPPIVEAMEDVLGRPVRITQGGYNAGQVSQSAGTHDAGGVLDLATDGTDADDLDLVRAGRTVGLWGWIRQPSEGPWSQHFHGAVIGCPHLSPQAKRQETDAYNGIDGLAGHTGLDPHRALALPVRSYSMYLESQEGQDMPLNADDLKKIDALIGSKFEWAKNAYLQPTLKGVTLTNDNVWKAIGEIRGLQNIAAPALAAELVNILGDELAKEVADELAVRLNA